MAAILMSKTKFSRITGFVREFSLTLSAPGNSDSILTPRGVQSVLVTLSTSGGEGKVQYTMSSVAEVKADTANWIDWDAGSVTSDTDDVLYPVTAIRMVNVSGSTTMYGEAR